MYLFFFFSSRRRHTRLQGDWSSDVCSSDLILERLYPANHPYHWPVIGSMADLQAATLADVRQFFQTYYTPNNATLAIAGDITARDARQLVERYFGEIPRGPAVEIGRASCRERG